MTASDASIIQQIIAPATMIPACGLLLLSSTARMNTVLARIRTFHAERLSVWKSVSSPGTRDEAVRALRLEGLELQTRRLLGRAGLLRVTMLLLFVAVACNLLSVIGLALALVFEEGRSVVQSLAVALFVGGVVIMLVAMITSFREVFRITETVRYEHARVEALCGSRAPDGDGVPELTGHAGEGFGL